METRSRVRCLRTGTGSPLRAGRSPRGRLRLGPGRGVPLRDTYPSSGVGNSCSRSPGTYYRRRSASPPTDRHLSYESRSPSSPSFPSGTVTTAPSWATGGAPTSTPDGSSGSGSTGPRTRCRRCTGRRGTETATSVVVTPGVSPLSRVLSSSGTGGTVGGGGYFPRCRDGRLEAGSFFYPGTETKVPGVWEGSETRLHRSPPTPHPGVFEGPRW